MIQATVLLAWWKATHVTGALTTDRCCTLAKHYEYLLVCWRSAKKQNTDSTISASQQMLHCQCNSSTCHSRLRCTWHRNHGCWYGLHLVFSLSPAFALGSGSAMIFTAYSSPELLSVASFTTAKPIPTDIFTLKMHALLGMMPDTSNSISVGRRPLHKGHVCRLMTL